MLFSPPPSSSISLVRFVLAPAVFAGVAMISNIGIVARIVIVVIIDTIVVVIIVTVLAIFLVAVIGVCAILQCVINKVIVSILVGLRMMIMSLP